MSTVMGFLPVLSKMRSVSYGHCSIYPGTTLVVHLLFLWQLNQYWNKLIFSIVSHILLSIPYILTSFILFFRLRPTYSNSFRIICTSNNIQLYLWNHFLPSFAAKRVENVLIKDTLHPVISWTWAGLKPLSVPRVFSHARWRKDLGKVSIDLAPGEFWSQY